MVNVEVTIFEKRLKQLIYATIQATNCSKKEISFRSGLWYAEEGYKVNVHNDARKALNVESWSSPNDDSILTKVFASFAVLTDEGIVQNLVTQHDITETYFALYAHSSLATQIFYNFYKDLIPDSQAYSSILNLLPSNKAIDQASVLAYLFFLKDRSKYIPMRTKHFSDRIEMLNVPKKYLQSCTWENYQVLNAVMQQLADYLSAYFADVELVDAQSFFWMFYKIDNTTPEYELYRPEDNVSVVIVQNQNEGQKKQYYCTKYERSSKNRAAAIKHWGLSCYVCGFNFQQVYGNMGKDFIEVHHIKPLATLDSVIEIDPKNDLVCVCANCHRMIHHRVNAVLTPDELKEIIRKNKVKS